MLKKIIYAGLHDKDEKFLFGRIDIIELKKATGNIPEPYHYSLFNPKTGTYSKRRRARTIQDAKQCYWGKIVNCVLYDEDEKYLNIVFNSKEI